MPDPPRLDRWRGRVAALGAGLKVGIAWRSQSMEGERKAAYVTLDAFAPLFALPGVVFVNLQYGECAAEIAAAEERFGVTIRRWDDLDLKDDFEAAAALTGNLDIVITPAVSSGELAGALGVPVWKFGHRDWTQLGTGVRPWFPTMRLFQPRPGEALDATLGRMAAALRRLMPEEGGPSAIPPVAGPPAAGPDDPDSLLETAAAHHREGRLSEAAPLYERALKAQADHPVALHLSGLLAHQTGDSAGGAQRIARALDRMPAYGAAQSSLGTVLLALGRAAEAVRRFRLAEALLDRRDPHGCLYVLAPLRPEFDGERNLELLSARALVATASLVPARDKLERLLASHPDDAYLHHLFGRTLRRLGDERAPTHLAIAAALDPGYAA